ncbi:MAG: biosynthetic-type acetolactate synthase large subunit [Candidatus Altiarchaeum hamiconexum]|uniref:Acetolactate synthase n=1 Tax=Candidatus Altarchaeum hamiconexum TaxID=1803513 RepID=A0A8J8CEL3_9ARCH|nr:biosynthetic-type acetolactate synthase large subunit [Candidatus Altarchaeum hamiconexum]PIN67885.1 MAG: acetolactate synthase, large subunit, biosynthetic type [Candidatus Altarchaeum sp. CG12_big_fil_rev_8_21_14_0_65_33_22]PIX48872.1 MAG: acetolactate synthase, large subunit, biosynthetic type [Candidatus Altarchaeum sp. CG_4_8_14_3_um_filter_33_2054]PIZ33117.1 MAG: acetolactate synthase, large subunit, biosynthetic type [Candidatus Altarchaeum sp. CG_4_10_14_0_8_um_filter_32_851]NCS91423
MNGAEALIKSLESEGVKNIFGILGGSILDVYDKILESDIRHILVRHEQVAAHAAEGYARASGKTGVCFATSGPGGTNLVTGIADAFLDSVPVVAVTGQVPTYMIGKDAFQEADTMGITMPISKHNFQIRDPETIPTVVKSAFKIASTRRQGPVLIDFPKDMQRKDIKNKFVYPNDVDLLGYKEIKTEIHPGPVKAASELLLNAEMPLILAGGGVISSNASADLIQFAESLNIPVVTTLMGKGVIPETHPLAVGMVGMHGRKSANYLISECDILFAVGCRFSDRVTGDIKSFAPYAKIVHADIDAAEIGKNVRTDVPIVGDAKNVLRNIIEMTDKLKSKEKYAWSEKVKKYKQEYAPFYDYDSAPLKQQRVMKELNELIDDKTIIVTEVGQCQMWAAHYLNVKNPRQFISSGGLGTMGFGFPASIGAKVARPECNIIDVGSEGSFLMTSQDLATCVVENIPVVVLLLDNRWLGMVKQWQNLFYDKRYSATYLGEVPDFVKFAEAFSAKGIKVEKPDEIRPAFKEAIECGKPAIIDVVVDREEHILPMVRPGGKLFEMIEKNTEVEK